MQKTAFRSMAPRFLLGALILGCFGTQARAAFHLWAIQEVFTNANGTVQFIEMFTTFDSQQFTSGQTITTGANTFTFPGNTPSPTANKTLLLATPGFTAATGVTPDFTLVNNFFSATGDTINFAGGFSVVTFASAPTDGVRSLNYPGGTIALNSPKTFNGVTTYVAPTGDFDGSGVFDCSDVNALVANIVSANNNVAFDLTGDNLVNSADLTNWRARAGAAQIPSGNPYLPGDANLDAVVDGSDFNIWNSNKFSSTPAWCAGDFNADGSVDGSDFNIWNSNKFTASDGTTVVPEPWGVPLMTLALVAIFGGLRRGHRRGT